MNDDLTKFSWDLVQVMHHGEVLLSYPFHKAVEQALPPVEVGLRERLREAAEDAATETGEGVEAITARWILVHHLCSGPEADRFTCDEQEFNLATSAQHIQRGSSGRHTAVNDYALLEVGDFVATFRDVGSASFGVGKVLRIFKWREARFAPVEMREEIAKGDSHCFFFLIHVHCPPRSAHFCVNQDVNARLIPQVYKQQNKLAVVSGVVNKPYMEVISVSQVALGFPDEFRTGRKLFKRTFDAISERVAVRDATIDPDSDQGL